MPSYKDIIPFTASANYHINIPWSYLEDWLERQPELQLDPDFQRIHVWTKTQQTRYIEYALRNGMSGRDIYFNHPGWQKDYKGDFVLVDGKQRIEAVRAYLRGDVKAFGHYVHEYDSLRFIRHMFDFYINELRTRAEVLQWYIDLNTGGVIHSKAEIDRVKLLLQQELQQGA